VRLIGQPCREVTIDGDVAQKLLFVVWAWLRCREATLRRLGPEGLLDLGLRFGTYGAGWKWWKDGLSLRRLKESAHGIDLGPLTPCLPDRLRTPGQRIDLAPAAFLADLPRLRARFFPEVAVVPGGDPTLVLIGRRHLRSNNSWMHNSERLVRGKPRCTLLMHPADATRRGLADGATARLTSRAGSVDVPVELSDELMEGVVSLPHGWGHARAGVQLRTATRHPGVSANDVTDHLAVDALSGNAALNGVPVTVEPAYSDPAHGSPSIPNNAEARP
jgi:anaerobic selenocysteine-containing dehydrogenase